MTNLKFGKPIYDFERQKLADENGFEFDALMRTLGPLTDAISATTLAMSELETKFEEKTNDRESRDTRDLDEELRDQFELRAETVENLLGAAFVICQRYVTRIVSLLKRVDPKTSKDDVLRRAPPAIRHIEGLANYFKHRDEADWNSEPDSVAV